MERTARTTGRVLVADFRLLWVPLLGVLICLTGCTSTTAPKQKDVGSGHAVMFDVCLWNEKYTMFPLDGAEISLVTRKGEIRKVATTDKHGFAKVTFSTSDDDAAVLLLFCHKDCFCGAERVSPGYFDHDEYWILLAPFGVP